MYAKIHAFGALLLVASGLALGCTPVDVPKAHSEVSSDQSKDLARDASTAADAVDAKPGKASQDQQATDDSQTPTAGKQGPPTTLDAGAAPRVDAQVTAGNAATTSPANSTRPERSRDVLPLNQTEVPSETADVEALQALSQWDKLPVFASVRRQLANAAERKTSVRTDGDRDFNNFRCRSADAKVGTPTASYIYDRDQCEEDYVHGVELARFEGSGRLNRFWFAASRGEFELLLSNEMLRIYVDDNPRPLLQVRLSDAVSGAAGEIFAQPFGSGAPNSMTWYYPVVFSSKLIVAIDDLHEMYFYEVEAVVDETPKQRWAPLDRLSERDSALALLASSSPRSPADTEQRAEHLSLTAGEQRQVTLAGPSTTHELQLRVPTAKLATLAPLSVSVKWDDNESAAIDVPILALFAARLGPPVNSSLALTAMRDGDNTLLALRLPMPFQTAAQWTITNTGSEAVELDLTWLGAAGVPTSDFGTLHVQTFETALPARSLEQAVAQIASRGRLVGTCFDIAGDPETSTIGQAAFSRPLLFSAGDLNFSIDGRHETFATSTDTYSDDSFNFADAPRSTAFAQSWNVVRDPERSPQGEISVCRWHVLGNEVDFARELNITRELAIRDPSNVRLHRSIAYYYSH